MEVWVAQIHNYGGARFIGVYSTDERAMLACEADHKDTWQTVPAYRDCQWGWTERETNFWYGKPGPVSDHYTIRLVTVDEW